ncbi:MAG: chemotaxis protein CheW, partial [Candidatus Contubernalis sp.]|nr:chemotaxis protein CheW [Candidatus Contubernalis sp.]
ESESRRVIIVEVEGTQVGLLVDSVAEVIMLPLEAIQRPSSTIAGTKSQFLEGVGNYNDRLLIILKLDTILTTEERITLSDLQDWAEE